MDSECLKEAIFKECWDDSQSFDDVGLVPREAGHRGSDRPHLRGAIAVSLLGGIGFEPMTSTV